MSTCLNHPEVPTHRRCLVCDQFFCSACLEVYEPLGPLCAECELEVSEISATELLEAMPTLQKKIRGSLPPQRPWWGWELLFWSIVLLPTLLGGAYLYQMFRYHQALAMLSREPILPGIVTAQLIDLSASLERHWTTHQGYPDTLQALDAEPAGASEPHSVPNIIIDPYALDEEPFIYRTDTDTFLLCSRGPDRLDSNGAALDRFSGTGDICIGSLLPP